MKRLLIAAAVLLAAACQPMPAGTQTADQGALPPLTQSPSSLNAAECAARGGKMLAQGRMQTVMCVLGYADAGKRCTDGDDCQGSCRIEDIPNAPRAGASAVGRCQASSASFGCYTTVENGKAEATICVD